MNAFSLNTAINFGIDTLKRNLGKILLFELGIFLYSLVIAGFEDGVSKMYGTASALPIYALDVVIQSAITVGIATVTLMYLDGKEVNFENVWVGAQRIFNNILATFIFVILVVLGLVLLIVPGVILAIRLQFSVFYIAEENARPADALRMSFELTRGHTWDLFIFDLLFLAAMIVGLLAFIVGIFITMPIAYLALASVYRQLRSRETLDPDPSESAT